MQTFQNDAEFLQWVVDMSRADEPAKLAWQREIAVDMSYYEGYGWTQISPFSMDSIERLKVDLNPDSPEFRATLNRITAKVQRKVASTNPTVMTIRCTPPERNLGPVGTAQAQLEEDVANVLVEDAQVITAFQDANHVRWVCGSCGVGLQLRPNTRTLVANDEQYQSQSLDMKMFWFMALKLILDPGMQERNLNNHDFVMLKDTWTVHKFMRLLGPMAEKRGIKIDPSKLREMGQLNTFETTLNNLTYNRLFPQYRVHSKTKAVVVTMVHRKDDRGRFSKMDILLELEQGKPILLNPDDRESPFGGNGLPVRLLNCYRRADAMYPIGAVRMLKDDQDRLNRGQTCYERTVIQASHFKWNVDKRFFNLKSDKEAAKRISNAVAGVHVGDTGTKENPIPFPELVNVPPPSSHYPEMAKNLQEDMRDQVHISPGSVGITPTHVPNASFQTALNEGGAVDDQIIAEDKATYEDLLSVALGTAKALVQKQDPGILALLDKHGFSGDEMMSLARGDPAYPSCKLTISDGSIRHRSWNAQKQDLDAAAMSATPMIDAKTYRREMAGTMDAPLVQDDKLFAVAFAKMAAGVLTGEYQFEPLALDADRASDLLLELQRALVSRDAIGDPLTRQRVMGAIQSQRQFMAQMAAEVQATMMQGQAVAAGQQQNQSGAQGQDPEGNFSALVDRLSQQTQAA